MMTSLASHNSMSVFIQLPLHYEYCEIILLCVVMKASTCSCSNVIEEMHTLMFVMAEVIQHKKQMHFESICIPVPETEPKVADASL